MPNVELLLCSYASVLILLIGFAIYRLYTLTTLLDIVQGNLFYFTDDDILIHTEQKMICLYVGLVLASLMILAFKMNGLQLSAIVGISATVIYIVFFLILILCDTMQRRMILHSLHERKSVSRVVSPPSAVKKTIFDDIPNLHDNPYRNRPANLADPLTPRVLLEHSVAGMSTIKKMLFQKEHPSYTSQIDKSMEPAIPDLRSGFYFFLNIIGLALSVCCLREGIREEARGKSREKSAETEKIPMEEPKSSIDGNEEKHQVEKDFE